MTIPTGITDAQTADDLDDAELAAFWSSEECSECRCRGSHDAGCMAVE